jgi:hypothetical protein
MRRAALVFVLCCAQMTFGQHHAAASPLRLRRVPYFEVRNRNMIDALLLLGQQERIGIGIEYIDKAAFQKRVTLQFRDRNVEYVLNALTRPFGFRWSTDGQAITVTHTGAFAGSRNLLNTRIPKFNIEEMPLGQADCRLQVALYFAMNPNSEGVVGDCMFSGVTYRVGPLEMKNATVREILNRMVSQHGNGGWVVQQPPWTMDRDLGHGFWKVLPYDNMNGNYSKGLQVWGLGLHDP